MLIRAITLGGGRTHDLPLTLYIYRGVLNLSTPKWYAALNLVAK